MADLYTALLIVAAFNNFSLLYLLVKRPDRSVVTVSFMLFLVAINIWGIPQIVINFWGLHETLYTQIDRFSALGYVSIPVIFFIFSLGFAKKTMWFKNFGLVVYCLIPAILFLYFSWTTFFIDNHSTDAIVINEWGYNSSSGEYFGLFLAWLESLMIASIFVLAHYFRSISNPIRRKQTIFLIVAVLIPLVFGSITDGLLPMLKIHIFPSAVPLTTVMAILIGYAIMRYELFDVEPQTILSSLGEGLITVNTSGEIIQVSGTAESLIGRDKDSLIGRKFMTLIRTQTAREKQQLIIHLKKGKKIATSKCILKKEKKNNIPVSLSLTPLRQEGKLMGATILFRDISVEKKREENKDEFISIASHELKTPLTSLKLYTDLLMRKVDKKSEYAKYIERLHEEVNKVTTLTNDLLDLSRIRTGDIQLHLEEFNIRELVTNTISSLQKTISQKIVVMGTEQDAWVCADKMRISQVVVNFITNASKYASESEKIIVSIDVRANEVQVGVQDFGKGIPKSEHKKIFERFYHTGGVLAQTPSLGIGLYVSSNIVKRHKGQIWLESEEGKGTTFFFTVPRSLSHSHYLDQGSVQTVVK